jgi:hypothetical protein
MGTSTTNWQDIGSGQGSSGGNWTDSARQMADQARREGMEPQASGKPEQREGVIARTIEQQTAKLPSDMFLWAALGSIGVSLAFELAGDEKKANFVGHWAPTFLILGLYNKMVKLHGSDPA